MHILKESDNKNKLAPEYKKQGSSINTSLQDDKETFIVPGKLDERWPPESINVGAVLNPANTDHVQILTKEHSTIQEFKSTSAGLLGVLKTEATGFGIVAQTFIEKGTQICKYLGEHVKIGESEFNKLPPEVCNYSLEVRGATRRKKRKTDKNDKSINLILGHKIASEGSLINNSIDFANVEIVPNTKSELLFITTKNIHAGEEILLDYGKKYHGRENFRHIFPIGSRSSELFLQQNEKNYGGEPLALTEKEQELLGTKATHVLLPHYYRNKFLWDKLSAYEINFLPLIEGVKLPGEKFKPLKEQTFITPLMYACLKKHDDMMDSVFRKKGVNVDFVTKSGRSAWSILTADWGQPEFSRGRCGKLSRIIKDFYHRNKLPIKAYQNYLRANARNMSNNDVNTSFLLKKRKKNGAGRKNNKKPRPNSNKNVTYEVKKSAEASTVSVTTPPSALPQALENFSLEEAPSVSLLGKRNRESQKKDAPGILAPAPKKIPEERKMSSLPYLPEHDVTARTQSFSMALPVPPMQPSSVLPLQLQSALLMQPLQLPMQAPYMPAPLQFPMQIPHTPTPLQFPMQTPYTPAPLQLPMQIPYTPAPLQFPMQTPYTSTPSQLPMQTPYTPALLQPPMQVPYMPALLQPPMQPPYTPVPSPQSLPPMQPSFMPQTWPQPSFSMQQAFTPLPSPLPPAGIPPSFMSSSLSQPSLLDEGTEAKHFSEITPSKAPNKAVVKFDARVSNSTVIRTVLNLQAGTCIVINQNRSETFFDSLKNIMPVGCKLMFDYPWCTLFEELRATHREAYGNRPAVRAKAGLKHTITAGEEKPGLTDSLGDSQGNWRKFLGSIQKGDKISVWAEYQVYKGTKAINQRCAPYNHTALHVAVLSMIEAAKNNKKLEPYLEILKILANSHRANINANIVDINNKTADDLLKEAHSWFDNSRYKKEYNTARVIIKNNMSRNVDRQSTSSDRSKSQNFCR